MFNSPYHCQKIFPRDFKIRVFGYFFALDSLLCTNFVAPIFIAPNILSFEWQFCCTFAIFCGEKFAIAAFFAPLFQVFCLIHFSRIGIVRWRRELMSSFWERIRNARERERVKYRHFFPKKCSPLLTYLKCI